MDQTNVVETTRPAPVPPATKPATEPAPKPQYNGPDRRRQTTPERRAINMERVEQAVEAAVKPMVPGPLRKALREKLHLTIVRTMAGAVAVGSMSAGTAATAPATRQPKPQAQPAPRAQAEQVVVRNGVRCPTHDSVTGRLWLLYARAGAGVTLTQAKELAKANGLNETSAAIALYSWRKFHGVKAPTQA